MTRALLLLTAACIPVVTIAAQPTGREANFVRSFYQWYLPIALDETGQHLDVLHQTLKEKPQIFGSQLLFALKVDDWHRLHATELDSLDFDPVLNSQDPPAHYTIQSVTGDRVRVIGRDKITSGGVVIDVIVHCRDTCKIDNFLYPAQDGVKAFDLLSELRLLHPSELKH